MSAASILVVDDEPLQRWAVREHLQAWGYRVTEADSAGAALASYRAQSPDLVLLDLRLGADSGLDVLRDLREIDPSAAVIMVTAHGDLEDAVGGFRLGLTDFFKKPLDFEALQVALKYRFDAMRLRQEVDHERKARAGDAEIVGTSPAITAAIRVMHKVAASEATTVLLQGESGTGKDLFSKALHEHSARRDGPFIAVNCAALPDALLESELFGHERGAFTDAKAMKKGVFELADGGTLYLDEIGELKPALQAKLLRVLETMTFRRVGGLRDITVDTRVVAASNRNLEQGVQSGEFRSDLYYRLRVVTIDMPALRARREDIPRLVDHFYRIACEANAKQLDGITRNAIDVLTRYDWPGNVRELKNIIEGMVVMARNGTLLDVGGIPEHIRRSTVPEVREIRIPTGATMSEVERIAIEETMKVCGYNKEKCAKVLGIGLRTLYRKLKEFDIR